jgi:hypothetical protein
MNIGEPHLRFLLIAGVDVTSGRPSIVRSLREEKRVKTRGIKRQMV